MTSKPIVSRFAWAARPFFGWKTAEFSRPHPDLHTLAQQGELFPGFVRQSPVAVRYLELLGPLA